ncbi:50S ribosomal protein L3 N(5)-glutamine methyltransferase [Haliea sp. E1-2-M8]|uniref:50S ribosomal protein L3 N(5)-glutamine methyltransferase n=1 Tax=Haliea sp. E1-2-M8 TaxID=3064706 RepID=UPI0027179BF4|nr:50S ribosomal protein L3 N(5)-glutamine methyltransferase [Haliea sp. E1-2-M8]MDO8863903.1 50S ribosomal protein L3 N(5)-glutamine methyltransferase [Haliea sp. E1-2-M8]
MTTTHEQLHCVTSVGEALDQVAAALDAADLYYGHGTDNPWDEAVQLVLAVVGLPADSDNSALPHPVTREQAVQMASLLHRRIAERIPLPYLTGKAFFAGLPLRCDARAIIPRSPIAELVLAGFQPWYAGPGPERILDLCCGGGCIGLASAWYLPDARVDLLDLDSDALALAAENVAELGLEARVRVLQSDLFAAVPGELYDIIVSNPPYVDAGDLAGMPAEYRHEPALALESGVDGLDLTRRLLAAAEDYLQPTGLLVVEVGNSQEALEAAFPAVPFTWLEFEHGGHGVFALTARELRENRSSLRG